MREITLRRTADRVNHIAEEERYAMGKIQSISEKRKKIEKKEMNPAGML